MNKIEGKNILITGGTGSLGTALVERLLSGSEGIPESITVFSRDEDKQYHMRQEFKTTMLRYVIGDIRDYRALHNALEGIDVVVHAAALKHVPSCEDNPLEAILTNIIGTANLIQAARERKTINTVIGVSSDKGQHPVNVYGAAKFLQEKLLLRANVDCSGTRFVCVCYGNVIGSRGSIIPLFKSQIKNGSPVTVTDPTMTRFLISLGQAVDTLMAVLGNGQRGEVYIPIIPSAYVGDIASVLIGDSPVDVKCIGQRPGEKKDEVLITLEERRRVVKRANYYVITPHIQDIAILDREYNSKDYLLNQKELRELFIKQGVIDGKAVGLLSK